jgi:hypothetical protein
LAQHVRLSSGQPSPGSPEAAEDWSALAVEQNVRCLDGTMAHPNVMQVGQHGRQSGPDAGNHLDGLIGPGRQVSACDLPDRHPVRRFALDLHQLHDAWMSDDPQDGRLPAERGSLGRRRSPFGNQPTLMVVEDIHRHLK